jgi:hypothetical protein
MNFNRLLVVLAALVSSGVGCGGGGSAGAGGDGGAGTGPAGLLGIPLPSQVSALPTSGGNVVPSTLNAPAFGLRRAALVPSTQLPGGDYAQATTRTYVDERALSQFNVLNTIFNAVDQTNYADPANVNMGPYAAIVSWVQDDNGTQNKVLQKWIVASRRLTPTSDNVVLIWMPDMEVGKGTTALVRAHLVITTAPTEVNGSYTDFGVWRFDADAPSIPSFSFTATAELDPLTGHSVVKISQQNPGNEGVTTGILSKGATSGYGKVNFPDYSSCTTQDCVPVSATASYAYDADYVKMSKGGVTTVKARNDVVDIANRYALFDAVTGTDAATGHTFGFPFSYTAGGRSLWGGYQAWQGRHGIWANGATLAPGTAVVRGDRSNQTYTTSDLYTGVLVKRTLADSTLEQVVGAVAQTNLSFNGELTQLSDGTWWSNCNIAMSDTSACTNGQGDIRGPAVRYTDGFAQYAYDPNPSVTMRNVNMMLWNPAPIGVPDGWSGPVVYLTSGTAGATASGFYRAAISTWQLNSPPPVPAPANPLVQEVLNPGARVNLNVNENAWISYTGAVDGWVKKSVLALDQYNNPSFDPDGNIPFTLETNREYYLNDRGVNYVVTFDGASYSVKVEQQQVANPVNAAAMLEGIAYFKQPWGNGPTYTFDLATQKMKSGTPAANVTGGLWGLTAYNAADQALPAQFNWEYPTDGMGGNMGVQQFLLDGAGHLVVLDDPIRMQPQQLTDGSGATKTYSVVFDGSWVGGLPEVWNDLQAASYNVSQAIKDKVVIIPSDLVFTDAADPNKTYLFKPLEVSQYLMSVSNYAGALDTTAASQLNLATVPTWQDWGMMTTPPAAVITYSEGKPVQ